MKILLPFDGSDCAAKTLEWASETFNKDNTIYYLLFVIPVLSDLNTTEYDIMDATAILKKAKGALEDAGCRVAQADYTLGEAVDQICRYAEEMDVDQVVIGSHGRTGLARILMGSISIRVLEHCHRPITVHRNVERNQAQVAAAAEHHASRHVIPGNTMF